MIFLGIDTSCYTTSIAIVNAQRKLLDDRRIVLPVPTGEKGLKQSTALFYHWRNLPQRHWLSHIYTKRPLIQQLQGRLNAV